MRKRVLSVVTGVLTVNTVFMAGLYLRSQPEQCDTSARGLVIYDERTEKWRRVQAGTDPDPERGPCRGRLDTTLHLSSG